MFVPRCTDTDQEAFSEGDAADPGTAPAFRRTGGATAPSSRRSLSFPAGSRCPGANATPYLPPAEKEGAGERRQAARSPQPAPPHREAEGLASPRRRCRPAAITTPERRHFRHEGTTSGSLPTASGTRREVPAGQPLAGGHLGAGPRPAVALLTSPKMAVGFPGGGPRSSAAPQLPPRPRASPLSLGRICQVVTSQLIQN
ncbi:uncharacterized protein LOC110401849 [Numida meleagris]|uniref:uncharacterized protein LOC110401849 n=1 Tax=Numida meleagris TaxID=8996 RepID=UPI000B3E28A5|nr:uncharacterized protein LOC110401849 [Numida meleagris]